MDIAGAKALKERLGQNGREQMRPDRADVPADAPPVYHWVGVTKFPSEAIPADSDDATAADGASLFSRLGFIFR